MKKTGVVLGMFFLVVVVCAVGEVEQFIFPEPVLSEWFPDKEFRTIRKVKNIEGIDLAFVLVREKESRAVFTLMVPLGREIPVGTTVKAREVSYGHNLLTKKNFLMIK